MATVPTANEVFTLLAFVVPGFIIAKTREQFVPSRKRTTGQELIEYVALGAINFAVFSPLVYLLTYGQLAPIQAAFGWIAITLLGPLLLGVGSALAVQYQWKRRILRSVPLLPLNLKSVHAVPTAWDWKFGNMSRGELVLVTLKDGTRFAGYCGGASFISSDPAERDLFLEAVYDIDDDDDRWSDTPKSVLITHGEIRTIEFWPVESQHAQEARQLEHTNGEGGSEATRASRVSTRNGGGETIESAKPG